VKSVSPYRPGLHGLLRWSWHGCCPDGATAPRGRRWTQKSPPVIRGERSTRILWPMGRTGAPPTNRAPHRYIEGIARDSPTGPGSDAASSLDKRTYLDREQGVRAWATRMECPALLLSGSPARAKMGTPGCSRCRWIDAANNRERKRYPKTLVLGLRWLACYACDRTRE